MGIGGGGAVKDTVCSLLPTLFLAACRNGVTMGSGGLKLLSIISLPACLLVLISRMFLCVCCPPPPPPPPGL